MIEKNSDASLYGLRLFNTLLLIVAVMLSSPIYAQRTISTFPHSENFNQNNYGDIVNSYTLTQGATHTWLPEGGWGGSGAAKFTPPRAEGYSGMGSFVNLSGNNGSNPIRQLNVRILIKHGPTYNFYAGTNKLMIFNRNGGTHNSNSTRPMLISGGPDSGNWRTYRPCHGTVCSPDIQFDEEFKIGSPDVYDTRFNEWVSVEMEANLDTQQINIYIDSSDGEISGLYATNPFVDSIFQNPGTQSNYPDDLTGYFDYVDIIGGYFNRQSAFNHSGAYFIIDELVIDTNRIGPPSGFLDVPQKPIQDD